MSLGFNPFDQKPKGNLIRKRKVHEDPSQSNSHNQIEKVSERNSLSLEGETPNPTLNSHTKNCSEDIVLPISRTSELILEISEDSNSEQDLDKLRTDGITKNKTIKLRSERRTELRTDGDVNSEHNSEQDLDKLRTERRTELTPFVPFSGLSGLQSKITEAIYILCRQNGSRVTGKLALSFLAKIVQTTPASVQVIERRLISRQIMFKFESKEGRGGWSRYSLVNAIFNEIVELEAQHKLRTELRTDGDVNSEHNSEQDLDKLRTERRTELRTPPPSMYSIVNKNTIHTGTENQNPPEPDSWAELREVDFSALERWNIRNNVIESFKKNKWVVSKEQLEDHIERFARYFTEPEFEARRSKINSPLGFFLGSIKIIARGEPDPIQDVKTQIELAQEISMKNRFAEMESRKRQFETFEKQLDQYRESEFDHWLSGLSKEQQEQIVSPNKMAQFGSVSYRLLLKSYYTETIWPEFKQTILNGPRA